MIGTGIKTDRIVNRLGDENVANGWAESDTTGWAGSGVTVARQTNFNDVATSIKGTASATSGQLRQLSMTGSMANGVKYRNYVRVYIPSANTTLDGIRFRYANNYQWATDVLTPTADTWTDYQVDFTSADASDRLYIYMYDGESVSTITVGDIFYVTAISIRERQ